MALQSLKRIGVLTPLAALLLVLVLIDVFLTLGNQSLGVDVAQRQQFIGQSIQLEGLHGEIVNTLAAVAAKYNDEQMKSLLASQGIGAAESPTPGGGGQ
jgi:hypothetical protein